MRLWRNRQRHVAGERMLVDYSGTIMSVIDPATGTVRSTAILIDVILRDRPHPEQGFRSCLGILRLARGHGAERLEAACERALAINARTMTSVKSILQNRLDGRSPPEQAEAPPITHANIRRAERAPSARRPQFFH